MSQLIKVVYYVLLLGFHQISVRTISTLIQIGSMVPLSARTQHGAASPYIWSYKIEDVKS